MGGVVDISVIPGDTDLNRLTLTEQSPAQAAVVMASSMGYTGPITLAATSCLRETAPPPYVPCASYGLATQLSKTALALTTGSQDTSALTVTANTASPGRTLNGKYLVAISALDASGSAVATGQAAINVNLADKFGIVANPGQLTLFPGGDWTTVQLALTNLSGVAGVVNLEIGISGSQAGDLSYTLTPRSVTTTRASAVPTTPQLKLKALETARSGNPNVNIYAKRGTTQIGNTTVDVQIDCNCRDTGAFVEPDVLTVQPSADPLSDTSPSGAYTVNTGFLQSTAGPIPHVEISGKVPQVLNAAAWGFSPNEKFFLVATLNPSAPSQTYLSVYDLSAFNRVVQNITIEGCGSNTAAACTPPPLFCFGGAACLSPKGTTPSLTMGHASWGFSPDDKTLLVAKLDVSLFPTRSYTLLAYDLGHANSEAMVSQQFSGGNAFWRFSPCGDMIMHFEQRANGMAIERDARFWALDGGHSPAASRLLATAIYTGNTANGDAPSARVVAASSIPSGSSGDFDVALTHLAVQGSARTDGFQSLQCRAR